MRFQLTGNKFRGIQSLVELRDKQERARIQALPPAFGQTNAADWRYIEDAVGTRIGGFVSKYYVLVQNETVIDEAIRFLSEHGLDSADIWGTWLEKWPKIWINVMSPTFSVAAGVLRDGSPDNHQLGFRFWNAYDGKHSVGCGVISTRMFCTNQMVHWAREAGTIHRHEGLVVVRDLFKRAWDHLELEYRGLNEKLKALQEYEVSDISQALERLKLGDKVIDNLEGYILTEVSSGKAPTAYDLYNALTWRATQIGNPDTGRKYLNLAGRILNDPIEALTPKGREKQ
jgi:hypothetical protein